MRFCSQQGYPSTCYSKENSRFKNIIFKAGSFKAFEQISKLFENSSVWTSFVLKKTKVSKLLELRKHFWKLSKCVNRITNFLCWFAAKWLTLKSFLNFLLRSSKYHDWFNECQVNENTFKPPSGVFQSIETSFYLAIAFLSLLPFEFLPNIFFQLTKLVSIDSREIFIFAFLLQSLFF